VKLRDALSSILRCAVQYEFLSKNPMDGLRLPPDKRGTIAKPWVTPAEFHALLNLIPEPYATMLCLAAFGGLRPSEIAALRWRWVYENSVQVAERFTRGDWSHPKTDASRKPIAVEPWLVERIHRLKDLTVEVRAGRSVRHYKLVKSATPEDLVFQSVHRGRAINVDNVLKRHIKPAAQKLGIQVHWRALRTSYGTWNIAAGSDVKSVQGQMRHTKPETTLALYAQFAPENQVRAAQQLGEYARQQMAQNPGPNAGPLLVQ
jgi:integrase